MHQALYRKWRPRRFDEVCGQEHVTDILRYETANGLISHAYLFCGSRGTGKTTCAKILAKAVNCENPQNGNPCCECAACRSIADGSASDVLEMDAASNNRVDDIRTILDEVIYTPGILKYRVYIIDEVHMLSVSAFNALLKTLEEPPAHVIFILATTELQKLPATVISRCQRFDFRRIGTQVLTSRLKFIAKEENIGLDDDAALIIARFAQGGMRDAISLFELCAAGGRVTAERVYEAVGIGGRERLSDCVRAVAAGDCAKLFDIVSGIYSSAGDIGVFWQELTGYYRDMLVLKTVGTDKAASYLDLTDAETADLSSDASMFTREKLIYHCSVLDDAYASMQRPGASPRTVAELALVRLSDERLSASPAALQSRIAAIESKLASGQFTAAPAAAGTGVPGDVKNEPGAAVPDAVSGRPAGGAVAAPVSGEKTERAAASPGSVPGAASVTGPEPAQTPARTVEPFSGWQEVLETLGNTNPGVASLLRTASAFWSGSGSERKVVIKYRSDVTRKLAEAPETAGNLLAALSSVSGQRLASGSVVFEKQAQQMPASGGGIPELDILSKN